MRWDLFCRVVDNFGDIGVGWRLAADLGARGEAVRLWVDDPSALSWMAPAGAPGVEVRRWEQQIEWPAAGDVVVELFGCDPPPAFVEALSREAPPAWINLEYLSAEDWVERAHALPSPQSTGPGAGLVKWFFFPGFTPATGGLLRETGLEARHARFERDGWLAAQGCPRRAGERVVSVFCYPGAPLDDWRPLLAEVPTLLLATPGAAAGLAARLPPTDGLRVQALPWLTQAGYDELLWAADLNFVRGEDSFVRAIWAGVPFVWQIYAQHDGAHAAKLEAFLRRFAATTGPAVAGPVAAAMRAWNRLAPVPPRLPAPDAWGRACLDWRDRLAAQPDLVAQLTAFARVKVRG